MRFKRKMRFMDPATGGEGGEGGSGTPAPDAAAVAAAAKAAADAAAAAEAARGSKPTDAEAKLLKEVMDKKAAVKALEAKLAEASEGLKKFDGIDPEQVRALIKAQADRETLEAEKRGEYDRVKAQMVETHTSEVSKIRGELQGQLTETTGKLQSLQARVIELTIGRNFGDSQFVREQLTLTPSKARTVYGSHFELNEHGEVVGYDKPAGSTSRTPYVDATGSPLSFDEAIAKIVQADPDHDALIRVPMKPGSGSRHEGGGKGGKDEVIGAGRERIEAVIKKGGFKLPFALK